MKGVKFLLKSEIREKGSKGKSSGPLLAVQTPAIKAEGELGTNGIPGAVSEGTLPPTYSSSQTQPSTLTSYSYPILHCQIWEMCQSASLAGFPNTMWHGSKKAPTSRNVTNCETQLSENPVTEWENKIIVFPCVHWPIFIVRVKRFVNFNNGRKIISVTLTAQHWIPVWMHAQGWTLLHCTHWIEWRWETHGQCQ